MEKGEVIRKRRISRVVIGLVVAGACIRIGAAEPTLTICLDRGLDPAVVGQAQAIAGQMFSRISVETKWYGYHGSCPQRQDKPIVIRMTSHTSENDYPGALAYARPFEGTHVQVFYDRVRRTTEAGRVPSLLAHVLVHEITHIIQGTDQHSRFGVMKAQWDSEDYSRMARSPLGFTEEDLQLIRNGLAARIPGKQNPTRQELRP